MKLYVVAGLHGNERFGIKVLDLLKDKRIKGVIGNKMAIKLNKRFIDTDLNRSFPGNPTSNSYEERRAYELIKKLKNKIVIDLHSSTSNTPSFAIITKANKETLSLAISTGIKKICLMTPKLANGKSLIDNVKVGVSLEMGKHNNPLIIKKAYNFIINVLNNKPNKNPEFYKITDMEYDLNKNVKNFVFNGEYYPILVDEASYKGIKCLKAEKVKSLI